ncbi:hypothetical protein DFH29DRAFT_372824 [Suillus ampliporus]|nr:hypothetical protein DFH29DRAFT_372824 [Suillus ampliporus]
MPSPSSFHLQSTHPPYVTAYARKARPATGHSSAAHMATSTHEHRSRANRRPSGQMEHHPMLGDMALIASVAAASTDHREFLWYGVWTIAIKDYMFHRCHTSTTACNLMPQYVLLREYNPPDSTSSHVSPCNKREEWVVPDFALVLQRIRPSSHAPAMFQRQRVIVIVENKPARDKILRRARAFPFAHVEDQITRQAVFAFASDPTLNTLGIIIAFGEVWQYSEVERPPNRLLSSWSEAKDPTWGTKDDTIPFVVPAFLKKLSTNHAFYVQVDGSEWDICGCIQVRC